jgi:glycosylphosphatidylinositol transamidase (GPIT) subunit GPI8
MNERKPITRTKTFSFDMWPVWESNPIPRIQQAVSDSDWFLAVVFSAIQLERFGYYAILDFFESLKPEEKEALADILEPLSLTEIASSLQKIKIVSHEEFSAIMAINDERNKFVHRRKIPRFARTEAKTKYLPLVKDAMAILRNRLKAEEKRLP